MASSNDGGSSGGINNISKSSGVSGGSSGSGVNGGSGGVSRSTCGSVGGSGSGSNGVSSSSGGGDKMIPITRIDAGVCEGSTIGVHYDPMIAKVVSTTN